MMVPLSRLSHFLRNFNGYLDSLVCEVMSALRREPPKLENHLNVVSSMGSAPSHPNEFQRSSAVPNVFEAAVKLRQPDLYRAAIREAGRPAERA